MEKLYADYSLYFEGDIKMQNLLKEGLGTVVEKTSLTRKLTIDGVTKAYPVYRVRLDQLFL